MIDIDTVLVDCPKHGIHNHVIVSDIQGYEGQWCLLCWIASMGPSLPIVSNQETKEE